MHANFQWFASKTAQNGLILRITGLCAQVLHVNHERFQQLFHNEFFIKNAFSDLPRFSVVFPKSSRSKIMWMTSYKVSIVDKRLIPENALYKDGNDKKFERAKHH